MVSIDRKSFCKAVDMLKAVAVDKAITVESLYVDIVFSGQESCIEYCSYEGRLLKVSFCLLSESGNDSSYRVLVSKLSEISGSLKKLSSVDVIMRKEKGKLVFSCNGFDFTFSFRRVENRLNIEQQIGKDSSKVSLDLLKDKISKVIEFVDEDDTKVSSLVLFSPGSGVVGFTESSLVLVEWKDLSLGKGGEYVLLGRKFVFPILSFWGDEEVEYGGVGNKVVFIGERWTYVCQEDERHFPDVSKIIQVLQGGKVIEVEREKASFCLDVIKGNFSDSSCLRVSFEGRRGYLSLESIEGDKSEGSFEIETFVEEKEVIDLGLGKVRKVLECWKGRLLFQSVEGGRCLIVESEDGSVRYYLMGQKRWGGEKGS